VRLFLALPSQVAESIEDLVCTIMILNKEPRARQKTEGDSPQYEVGVPGVVGSEGHFRFAGSSELDGSSAPKPLDTSASSEPLAVVSISSRISSHQFPSLVGRTLRGLDAIK
jgi:hypothetical protein